ncbi:mitochondrial ribosomal protein subunit L20-domain-containing protein [Rhodotorula diobovata]|uniref:Mitochondrial ribosomal protein subunit L20-domain-containing protein n=1 Tax=Rhodotorula diobovata TaxID=5288 RepID=A0A5C5G0P5_9BASI|nr:mitochondrial ribosomal protein subunit L20-domain-containing protein [Rhodotorula diobovata]
MLPRAFSATAPTLKQAASSSSSSAAAPLRRTRDPLVASSRAHHFRLDTGAHFVARPPPSILPPTVPIPHPATSPLPRALADSPFAHAVAPSPFAPDSPAAPPSANEHRLPPLRAPSTSATTPATTLSPAEVAELQSLRRSAPAHWTRSRLARRFGISQQVVGTLGWGEGPEARRAELKRQEQVVARQAKVETRWGWKKEIAREERRRRREMW